MPSFLKTRVAINAASNVAAGMVGLIAGLIAVARLVSALGTETYGYWALISALTAALLTLLTLGVTAAVARLIAARIAGGRFDDLNKLMSTFAVFAFACFIVIVLASTFGSRFYFALIDVPDAMQPDITSALFLSGMTVACTLFGSMFSGLLWGYERFDLRNAIEIPITLIRLGLVLWFVHPGISLTFIAGMFLATTVLSVLLSALVSYWLDPKLRLRPSLFDASILRELYAFGSWFFLIASARSLTPQLATIIVGSQLGASAAAVFSVARQLIFYVYEIAVDLTQVMAPRAVAYETRKEGDKQRALMLDGGRFALANALWLAGGVLCFGLPFLQLWQHDRLNHAYEPMLVLLVGETFAMAQLITYALIIGTSRLRPLAIVMACEAAFVLIAGWCAIQYFGLFGICVAIAIGATGARGIAQCILGCRQLSIPLSEYLAYVVWPVLVVAIPPIGISYYFCALIDAADWSWISLIAAGTAYCVFYISVVGMMYYLAGKSRICVSLKLGG